MADKAKESAESATKQRQQIQVEVDALQGEVTKVERDLMGIDEELKEARKNKEFIQMVVSYQKFSAKEKNNKIKEPNAKDKNFFLT